jgi:hypothetical protein
MQFYSLRGFLIFTLVSCFNGVSQRVCTDHFFPFFSLFFLGFNYRGRSPTQEETKQSQKFQESYYQKVWSFFFFFFLMNKKFINTKTHNRNTFSKAETTNNSTLSKPNKKHPNTGNDHLLQKLSHKRPKSAQDVFLNILQFQ